MLNLLIFTASTAFSQEPEVPSNWGMSGFDIQETRIMAGVVGEFWSDTSIIEVYKASEVLVDLSLHYRFHQHFSVGAQIGYIDLSGNNGLSTLQIIPTVLSANVLFGNERVEPFVGLGLSVVHFLETASSSSATTVSGTKVGLDIRSGFRIKTNFIQKQQHPNVQMGPKQMDIEVHIGQRSHQILGVGAGEGFNLSALRLGVGLNTRF